MGRFGGVGSLSATSSATARLEKIATAAVDPMSANGEPWRSSQPRCVAQLPAAGAVSDRKPATKPMPAARMRTYEESVIGGEVGYWLLAIGYWLLAIG